MHSFDSKLEVSDDVGFSSPVEILNVRSFAGGEDKATMSSSAHLRSTNAVKTKDVGMVEEGARNYEMLYSKTPYAALRAIFSARTAKYWRETLPDGSTLIGLGAISSLGKPTAPEDDEMIVSMEITPTAEWNFAAAP